MKREYWCWLWKRKESSPDQLHLCLPSQTGGGGEALEGVLLNNQIGENNSLGLVALSLPSQDNILYNLPVHLEAG